MKDKIRMYLIVSLMASLATALLLVSWAATSYTFSQSLTVPETKAIKVFKFDGVTEIPDALDISADWGPWSDIDKSFSVTIKIKNVGTATVTTDVSSLDIPNGWTLNKVGTGSLAPTVMQTVTVTLSNPSATSGSIGTFHITITAI